MRAANVSWAGLDLSDVKEMDFTPEEFEVFSLRNGDVLVGEASGSRLEVGKSAVWRDEVPGACFQNTLIRVRCGPELLPGYVQKHLLHDARSGALAQVAKGIGIHHIGAQGLANWVIGVPPLSEQKRIADKLDALLRRVGACRQRLHAVATALSQFRQSVLLAATCGDLTTEWRVAHGEPAGSQNFRSVDTEIFGLYSFPNGWARSRLEEIASVIGGITKDAKKQSTAFEALPYLRVANVQRGYLDLREMKTIRVPPERLRHWLLQPGDILFNEGGDLDKLGRGWIWSGELPQCVFQNHVFRARLHDRSFDPRYFSWYGNSRGHQYFLARGKQTTNLASINRSVLAALPVAVPPPAEQAEIVRRVSRLLDFASRIEAACTAAAQRAEGLPTAVLAKAFRGELVEQEKNEDAVPGLCWNSQLRSRTKRIVHDEQQ